MGHSTVRTWSSTTELGQYLWATASAGRRTLLKTRRLTATWARRTKRKQAEDAPLRLPYASDHPAQSHRAEGRFAAMEPFAPGLGRAAKGIPQLQRMVAGWVAVLYKQLG